ncbi:uncharacterized protein LOC127639391 [Xyrauchen texanus]|uniref:uncharacterized protein LOC127639391 n=1 Tax=Xyrauchen texanus TaxID=154827 RepID=UPI002241FEDD|nr:uncharacterized protein LOC127639391 [Xyrauchen texanus]
MRGFNTHTFSAVLHKRLTIAAPPCLWPLCVCARCSCLLPLPLKHHTGFECDRLMIGCSTLSPASLGVLDRLACAEEAGTYGYGYLRLPFPGVFGVDEMKTVSVMDRDSLTLRTAVTGLQNDKSNFIKWYFNNIRVAQINGDLSEFCTDVKCPGGYNETFRDRLKMNNQTGSLTIMNIRITDSGDYLLRTIINNNINKKIFTVTVQPGVSGAEMKIKSVIEGDSVTLHTDDTVKQGDVVITWFFNDTRIAEMNEDPSKSCTDVTCDEGAERFRDRLKIDHQTGDLTITNTRTTDSGLYQLEISSSISSSFSVKSFSVNVSVSDITPDSGRSSGDVGGICVAVGVVVVLVVGLTADVIYNRCTSSRQRQYEIRMKQIFRMPKSRRFI